MAIEMIREISEIDDFYIKFTDRSKDLNEEFIRDAKDYLKRYSKDYITKNPEIELEERKKEAPVEMIIKRIERDLQKLVEEKQKRYNDVIKTLQNKMLENYKEKDEAFINAEKNACIARLEGIDDEYFKESYQIIDKNMEDLGDELKGAAKMFGITNQNRNIDRNIEKTREYVKYKLDYNKRSFIDRSNSYGREVIEDTARNINRVNEKNRETNQEDYVSKMSQEFNLNSGDQDRYDQFKEINEMNQPVDKDTEERLAGLLSLCGIHAKIENGRLIGADINNEPLDINYTQDGFELTDSYGSKYVYRTNGVIVNIECLIKDSNESTISEIYYDNEHNNLHVYISDDKEIYIDFNKRQVNMVSGFDISPKVDIPENLQEIKEIVDFYKGKPYEFFEGVQITDEFHRK